jgi:hypothetical protein
MHAPTRQDIAAAAAAQAEIVRVLLAPRDGGLDLDGLLAVRHLSRVCSFRCPGLIDDAQVWELERLAGELYATGRKTRPTVRAFLERSLGRVLGEMQASLARAGS